MGFLLQQAQDYQNNNTHFKGVGNVENNFDLPHAEYGQTDDGLWYNRSSTDSYVNALNQSQLWAREDMLRKEGYAREDSAVSRYFKQLQNAGVNPALALSLGSDFIGSSGSGQSASTYKGSDGDANNRTQETNSANVIKSIISAIALLGVAVVSKMITK